MSMFLSCFISSQRASIPTSVLHFCILPHKWNNFLNIQIQPPFGLYTLMKMSSKGEVSPNNNMDWVSRKQFYKPNSKVWADFDNPFKGSDYVKLCKSPSLDGTLPEYVISQEDNSSLTLYIDFHNFLYFSWISIVLLIKFIHKCMHIHLSPNIPKHKRRGKIHFQEK